MLHKGLTTAAAVLLAASGCTGSGTSSRITAPPAAVDSAQKQLDEKLASLLAKLGTGSRSMTDAQRKELRQHTLELSHPEEGGDPTQDELREILVRNIDQAGEVSDSSGPPSFAAATEKLRAAVRINDGSSVQLFSPPVPAAQNGDCIKLISAATIPLTAPGAPITSNDLSVVDGVVRATLRGMRGTAHVTASGKPCGDGATLDLSITRTPWPMPFRR